MLAAPQPGCGLITLVEKKKTHKVDPTYYAPGSVLRTPLILTTTHFRDEDTEAGEMK